MFSYPNRDFLQDLKELIERLVPKTRYFLCGVKNFERLLAEAGAKPIRQYQLGPDFWLYVVTEEMKIFVSPNLDLVEGKLYETSKEFVQVWLDSGTYDPTTKRYIIEKIEE